MINKSLYKRFKVKQSDHKPGALMDAAEAAMAKSKHRKSHPKHRKEMHCAHCSMKKHQKGSSAENKEGIKMQGAGKEAAHDKKHGKHKKNWIANAISKPGALHREMGVKAGHKIPAGRLAAAAKKGGKIGKRARLAETLKGMHHKKHKVVSNNYRNMSMPGSMMGTRFAGNSLGNGTSQGNAMSTPMRAKRHGKKKAHR